MMTQFGYGTHLGLVRENNEDDYAINTEHDLFIVADGMGGSEAGEIASHLVVEQILHSTMQGTDLKTAIKISHQVVVEAPVNGMGTRGMGSTVVALKLAGNSGSIAWVGDSRAYLWDNGLIQLTHDHSYVQYLIDTGMITETEAIGHPDRNQITQAIGIDSGNPLDVGLIEQRLFPGQKILLCSDGLTSEVLDKEISRIIAENRNDDQAAVDCLIKEAIDNGGKDNITIILVSAPSSDSMHISRQKQTDRYPVPKNSEKKNQGRRLFWSLTILFLVLCCLAISYKIPPETRAHIIDIIKKLIYTAS